MNPIDNIKVDCGKEDNYQLNGFNLELELYSQ